jgi:hypothetical protein
MNHHSYRRGFLKGTLAMAAGFFFVGLTRIGLRATEPAAVTTEPNPGWRRVSDSGRAMHGFEGVTVAAKEAMMGSGRKLG